MKVGIYLVRHGQTLANEQNMIQGSDDCDFSNLGKRQVEACRDYLQDVPFTHAYSSDLGRAIKTAKTILSKQNKDITLVTDHRIREREYGIMQGVKIPVLLEAAAKANSYPPVFTPEGAETIDAVRDRAGEFFNEMCASLYEELKDKNHKDGLNEEASQYTFHHDPSGDSANREAQLLTEDAIDYSLSVLVVAHGRLILELLRYLFESFQCRFSIGWQKVYTIPQNTSVTVISVSFDDKGISKIECPRINETPHLDKIS